MTVAGLRTRLRFLQRGGVPVPLPRSRVPPGGYRGEATSGSSRAGLTVTVRNSPPKTASAPPVTGTSLPMELPRVLRAPPRCLSSRKCMMSSLEHGRHLSLPETAPVAHPPSPPLTAERRGGIRRSHRWNNRLRCNCVQGPLLPGAVIRCSPPGPVGTRRP